MPDKIENTDFDVIIVGGGMVGATLACGLAVSTEQLRIAVIDAREPKLDWDNAGYDLRVSAITRASQTIFRNIGAWDKISQQRVSPYRDMFVWDAGGNGELHFDSADLGEPDLGHIIENRVIVKALHQRMHEFQNIELLCPAQIEKVAYHDDQATLVLQDKSILSAKLIVGADGYVHG